MSESVTIVGNYVSEYGDPVLATELPGLVHDSTVIGGYVVSIGWTCRWIKALAPDSEPVYSGGKLRWEHGGTRHELRPTQWIVWDGERFRTLPPGYFNSRYKPVNFPATLKDNS